jgi:GntR family transcriptional regulator/MocR family aminotransferase
MIPLKHIINVDKSSETPVYLQICNAFIYNIRMGILRRGIKLAGSRELALEIGVHRNTMLAALDELQAQGWIEIVPRKGTFVASTLPDIKPKKIVAETDRIAKYPDRTLFTVEEKPSHYPLTRNFNPRNLVINDGFPDVRLAPIDLLMRELRSLSRRRAFQQYLGYSTSNGPAYLLDTLSTALNDSRGLSIDATNLLITKGAQMGIYLAAQILLKPGDEVVVGEPSYFAANVTFQKMGANLNRIPVDDHGIDVNALERLCKKKKIRMLYVIPHHHHPTTVTLSADRRMKILQLAAAYKFAIIEDDYDYDYHYSSSPVLPMASLDHHGNIIYIGTLAKTLVPAIRVGFMVAPENFIRQATLLRRTIDRQGDTMMEMAIAKLYKNGTINRHIKKVVKIYRERRDHWCLRLKEELGKHISFTIPEGGMSVWATFHGVDLKQLSSKANDKGLTISDGTFYNSHNVNYNATRMGFASLNLKEQNTAIDILRKCLPS